MFRIGVILLCGFLFSCKDKDDKQPVATDTNSFEYVVKQFGKISLPYQLSDTALAKGGDTASSAFVGPYISDSVKSALHSGNSKITYHPIGKIELPDAETYLLVKAVANEKAAAYLLAFDKTGKFAAALPFLVPDGDPSTVQLSSIDPSYSITRNIQRRKGFEILAEGKDVFSYDRANRNFSWVVTDLLDDKGEIINPIDTLSRNHRLSGDYRKNAKNLVSVRDGRSANQLMVYIHTENEEGNCKGDLKGAFMITSSNTAVYREGGDPCVLQLTFSGNSVEIMEERGCGNHRDVSCIFEGSFTKKKEIKAKEKAKKEK